MLRETTRLTLLLALVFVLVGAVAQADSYTGTVQFPLRNLEMTKSNGFDLPVFTGESNTQEVGAPSLPTAQINVALPPGAQVVGFHILTSDWLALEGRYDILPTSEPIPINGKKVEENLLIKSESIYSRDQDYPGFYGKNLSTWELSGQDFVTLQFYPVQYNPVTQVVTLHHRIEFEVLYETPANASVRSFNYSPRAKKEMEQRLKNMAHNPENVRELPRYQRGLLTTLEQDQYDYVIITVSGFVSNFQPLADWRNQSGFRAKIVELSWIYANYPAADTCLQIRDFIKDAHQNWGTLYFLLGGDTAYFPFKMISHGGDIPSDAYFADYNKNYNYDVYVGRACVNNTSQVNTFVNKILTYEKNPPAGFGDEFLLLGFDLDNNTKGEISCNTVADIWVPDDAELSKEYDSESGGHETDTKNYMNQGKNLIYHVDHCNTDYLGIGSHHHGTGFNSSEAANFSNSLKYSNLYTLGCWPGNFPSTCWGETFVRDNNGGITFTGNSRYGWYSQGSTNQLSFKFCKTYWQALYAKNAYRAGYTLAESKNFFPMGQEQYIWYEINTLGCPALPFWTDIPINMTVSHDAGHALGEDFEVHVADANGNVEDALVCLMLGNELHATGLTDSSGNVSIPLITSATGSMTVTVTAQNHKYYQGTATLTAPLVANTDTLSVSGGSVYLTLEAGAANSGRVYLILGTMSGVEPGLPLPGGLVTMPLNWDNFTNFVIEQLNTPVLTDFMGTIDAFGFANASINTGAVTTSKIGKVMHFCFILDAPFDFTSNAVPIEFVP